MAGLVEYLTRRQTMNACGDIGELTRVYIIKAFELYISLLTAWSYDMGILSYDQNYINYAL
jgi:hypothetical protein